MDKNKTVAVVAILFLIGCKNKKLNEKIPITDLAFPFTYTNRMMDSTLIKGRIYQVEKRDAYKANDIVVFTYDDIFLQKRIRVAYRVVGTPGDTVQIKKTNIFVNNRLFPLPSSALFHYCVVLKRVDEEIKAAFNVQDQDGEIYDCFFTERDSFILAKKYKSEVVSIRKCPLEYNFELLLNHQNRFGWDMSNFGPVVIPKVNSSVSMDYARQFFYEYHDSQKTGEADITQPYYFVMGDNFDDASSDSRSIGLIGYNQIEGALKR